MHINFATLDQAGVRQLFTAAAAGDVQAQTSIIQYMKPRIQRIASALSCRRYGYQDLYADGLYGLAKAIKVLDGRLKNHANPLSYCFCRIVGSMKDALRANRFAAVRAHRLTLERALALLNEESGSERQQVTDKKLVSAIAALTTPVSWDDELEKAWHADAADVTERDVLARKVLTEVISQLPARQQKLIDLVFIDGISLKDIGRLLPSERADHVSEPRVSQLKAKALADLRKALAARGLRAEDFI